MSSLTHNTRLAICLLILCLFGLLAASAVNAGQSFAPPSPLSPTNLPNPITITGSPLRMTIGADSSIQVYADGYGQVYGWEDGSADSGIWLRVGGDLYGPDACFSDRLTTSMFYVRPWTAVSHTGPTGAGTAGDPWVVTTVLDAGATGVRVTQRATYVNGQPYFRLQWDVANFSGGAQAITLFHAVDSYYGNNDNGRGYYDAASGAVGSYYSVTGGSWYMLFAPTTPATAHQEGRYDEIWAAIGYCGDNMTCPVSGSCTAGPGFDNTIDTSAAGVDNGFGLQWQRTLGSGATATVGDWWTFGRTPVLPAQATSTPTPTVTPTVSRTPTATSTLEVCDQTITARYGPPSAANTWQRFTIPLTAATFNVDSATLQQVLSQVTLFRISTEMHDGADVGGLDTVSVGTRYAEGFDAGPAGWSGGGDGTLEWKSSGGNPGGHLQISDWASGDWHWAVAPVSWAGDWRSLIGANISFDAKTNYPDYASIIEISCRQTKRLTLAADPFAIPPGGSSNMTVSLSESAAQAVTVALNSSAPGCITVPASVTVPQGQTSASFPAQAAGGATPGCEAVITASHAAYGATRADAARGERHSDTHAHPDSIADANAVTHLHAHPWRLRWADRGGDGAAHAGLSPTHLLHQPAGRTHRWAAALDALSRRGPRGLPCGQRSGACLRHQYGWHGHARGKHAARQLVGERGHQCGRFEGALLGRRCGAHGQRGRQQPAPCH